MNVKTHISEKVAIVGVPLVYQREGFPTCVMILQPDGTVAHGPGHAEVHWSWDGENIVLAASSGQPTGRLEKRGDIFAGQILEHIRVSFYPFRWPAGYDFSGEVGCLLS